MTFKGGMDDLVWVRILSPRPLVIKFFSLTYNSARLFSSIRRNKRLFFCSVGILFRHVFPCNNLFPFTLPAEATFCSV